MQENHHRISLVPTNTSDISNTSSSAKISILSLSQRSTNLKVFTFEELKVATQNFSRSLMLGEGGFGPVYRGVLNNSSVAVKQLSSRGLQGHKEWVTEVNVLGIVQHPNLVKLIGYCAEDNERGIQRLLVYEYLPNKSVQDHISNRFQTPLPWPTRLKVARDAARGLAYLHHGMEFQVVGTVGYAAPEYIQTGRITSKSDVWSYGIFVYELITGRRPFDRNRSKNEQKLLDWVRPHLSAKCFEEILDPRLKGAYDLRSAQKLAAIANKCLVRHPKDRPKMSEVLEMIDRVLESDNGCSGSSSPDLIGGGYRAVTMDDDDEKWTAEIGFRRRWLSRVMGVDSMCMRMQIGEVMKSLNLEGVL